MKREIVRVREVMHASFDLVDGLMTVQDALRSMKHAETKTLIVDRRHDDDVYGMLLFADIAKKVLAEDRAPERVNVYEIMAKPVMCVDPEMDIRYCARLLDRFDLFTAPVVEHGRVIGVVSLNRMVLHGLIDKL